MLSDDELTELERRLVEAAWTGEMLDLQASDAGDGPVQPADCANMQPLRGELVAELLTGLRKPRSGQLQAVKIRGARITGILDLEAATVACPLLLQECCFDQPINLKEAQAASIRFPGCHVPSVAAYHLHTKGNLELDEGFTASGNVNLESAHIGGSLEFDGAHLTNPSGPALTANQLTVEENMSCEAGFTAEGEVLLNGARIGGQLRFSGARLANRDKSALSATMLTVGQGAYFSDGFTAQGEVELSDARISGQLDFSGATLTNPGKNVLSADRLTVDGNLSCQAGFTTEGQVQLIGAHVSGQLKFDGAHLKASPGMRALLADGATAGQGLFFLKKFTADGEVRLSGAHIGGQLYFSAATLTNPGGIALFAERITVDQDMFFREGSTAQGEVVLLGAHIGGQLDFSKTILTAPNRLPVWKSPPGGGIEVGGRARSPRPALTAEGLTVEHGMFCSPNFIARGEVQLVGARIDEELDFSGATLRNPDGLALDLEQASATTLILPTRESPEGKFNLANARVDSLHDEKATWPQLLSLDGLTYSDLTYMPARERLDWLNLSAGYSPQPYEQLAAYYRRLGHDDQARRVLLAKQRQRGRQRPWWARWWGWLQDALVGYGYAPGRALLLLAGAFVAGWLVFSTRHPAPVGPAPHPAFNAALYTLDVLVPAPALGQASDWDPHGAGLAVAAGLHVLGWLLAITVIAAITRSFSRT